MDEELEVVDESTSVLQKNKKKKKLYAGHLQCGQVLKCTRMILGYEGKNVKGMITSILHHGTSNLLHH